MKLKTILCAVFAATLLGSCNYDDGELWDAVNGQEERISALEKWQKTVNEQLNSLQGILTAADYVTEVTSVEKDGKKGYKISFLHADPITLYYNENNEVSGSGDNAIGVDKDDTGWFWTMGGKPLEIETGKKVYVTGETITATYNPDSNSYTIKIGNQTLEVAEAPVVHPIKGVTTEGNIVTVELADGSTVELVKYIDLSKLMQDKYSDAEGTKTYDLKLPNGYIIDLLGNLPDEWIIKVDNSTLTVTYPSTGKIIVKFLISDGQTQTIIKTVSFEVGEPMLEWTTIEYTGSDITIEALKGASNIKVIGDTQSAIANSHNVTKYIKLDTSGVVNLDLSEVIHNNIVPANAFFNGGSSSNTHIETIILPKTITGFYKDVFKNCTALKSVTIPASTCIGYNDIFSGCEALKYIYVPKNLVDEYQSKWTNFTDKIAEIPMN